MPWCLSVIPSGASSPWWIGPLAQLPPTFDQMYAQNGRASIPPEHLLKACVLMALFPEELAKYLVGFFYVAAPDQFSADGLPQAASQLVNTTYGESNVPMLPVRGPNQVERYQERFYDAVSACHRDVVNEIGPPL